jgi:hypothetical protein
VVPLWEDATSVDEATLTCLPYVTISYHPLSYTWAGGGALKFLSRPPDFEEIWLTKLQYKYILISHDPPAPLKFTQPPCMHPILARPSLYFHINEKFFWLFSQVQVVKQRCFHPGRVVAPPFSFFKNPSLPALLFVTFVSHVVVDLNATTHMWWTSSEDF